MEDGKIVELFWQRDDTAINATSRKYGPYCHAIAYRIVLNSEDAEECVNDTYLAAWNSIPPHRPGALSTYLGKLTRRISLNRWRHSNQLKRGGGEVTLAIDELEECVAGSQDVEQELQRKELIAAINRFLDELPVMQRRIFLRRYWYLDSIAQISGMYHISQSKVYTTLHRVRMKLRERLAKEGFV